MGIAGGVKNLQWLFTATFVVMLAAVPVFGAVVARLPRKRFVPLVYHFFVLNIAVFWLLLTLDFEKVHVARVFFVWISVFNLFAVSVFWSFMADLWTSESGKRLFGFIAAGGSAGALLGPAVTVLLAVPLGPVNLLIVAALLLELAVICAHRLESAAPQAAASAKPPDTGAIGGGWLAGLAMVLRSPYLAGIALWVTLLSLAGTFLYFQQANIVAAASDDPAVRTRIFAEHRPRDRHPDHPRAVFRHRPADRALRRRAAAAALPLVFALGFLALAFTPVLLCRDRIPGAAAHRQLRDLQSGARSAVHRARARGEVQGQERDRHRRVPRRGCGQRLAFLGAARAQGMELSDDLACHGAGGGACGWSWRWRWGAARSGAPKLALKSAAADAI